MSLVETDLVASTVSLAVASTGGTGWRENEGLCSVQSPELSGCSIRRLGVHYTRVREFHISVGVFHIRVGVLHTESQRLPSLL